MGTYRGIGGGIQIPKYVVQALVPFPAPPPERPGEFARRVISYLVLQHSKIEQAKERWCTFKSKSPVPSRDHLLRDRFESFKRPPLNLDKCLHLLTLGLTVFLGGGILLNVLFFSSTVDRHPSDSLHSPFCGRILTRVSDATQFIYRDGHLYVHCNANF